MKFTVIFEGSRIPLLDIEADNLEEKKQLSCLLRQLFEVQLAAIPNGKANAGNTCGSTEDDEGVMSLIVPVILGGVS